MFEKLLDFIVTSKVYFNSGGKNGYLEKDEFKEKTCYYFYATNLVFTHSMVESITFSSVGATIKLKNF
jgi:hypothetical protein